jgi:hypothetical protein
MNVTNQDFHIDSLHARITDCVEQLAEARKAWYEALPPLLSVESCPICANDWTDFGHLQRMEEGYARYTNGNITTDDGESHVHWSTDGWDDMSEQGDFEYVTCNVFNGGCGACFQIPKDEEWD